LGCEASAWRTLFPEVFREKGKKKARACAVLRVWRGPEYDGKKKGYSHFTKEDGKKRSRII